MILDQILKKRFNKNLGNFLSKIQKLLNKKKLLIKSMLLNKN